MTYFEELEQITKHVIGVLQVCGIESERLDFGGPGEEPEEQPRVPNDAQSEFLANRAMGDWAEKILASEIGSVRPEWRISHYGDSDLIAAGEPGFREFYLSRLEEVREYGKRPDLLIFPHNVSVDQDISERRFNEMDELVAKAIGAIEVRSSKFEANTYMEVRERQVAEGKQVSNKTPNYTVKVEDLKIVYRWIERYKIPQVYCQVFFDSVYAINVLEVFRIIAAGKPAFRIETPRRSQEKATIMIPITKGVSVGQFLEPPTFEARQRITELGRHDAYVVPKGGHLQVEAQKLESVLFQRQ